MVARAHFASGAALEAFANQVRAPIAEIRDLAADAPAGLTLGDLGLWHVEGWAPGRKRHGPRLGSAGKGETLPDRLRTAFCEVVERACVWQAKADVLASFRDLGAAALDPAPMALHHAWNPGDGTLLFDAHAQVEWSRAVVLASGAPILVHRPVRGGRAGFFRHTTNGAAVGASFDDATLRGLLELIERDALLIHWCCGDFGQPLPGHFSPDTARSWLESHGYSLALRDISLEFGVATVLGVAQRRAPLSPSTVVGCASALSWATAGASAVLEIVQAVEAHLLHGLLGDPRLELHGGLGFYAAGKFPAQFEPAFADLSDAKAPSAPTATNLAQLVALVEREGYEAFAIERTPRWLKRTSFAMSEVVVPGLTPLPVNGGLPSLRSPRLIAKMQSRARARPLRSPHPL